MAHKGTPYTPDSAEIPSLSGGITALTGDITGTGPGSTATTLAAGSASNLNSGTLPAGRLPALTGDVTTSAGSAATTLAAGSASNLNSGTLPAGRLPALTGDVTSSAGSAATTLAAGSASNLNSGTLPAGRMPALTGDVTSSAGAVATTLANTAVTPASYVQANITVDSKGRLTAAATPTTNQTAAGGNVTDLSVNLPGSGPVWDVWGYLLCAQGTALFSLQPNALATNQVSQGFTSSGTGGGSGFADTIVVLADGDATIQAKTMFTAVVTHAPGIGTFISVDTIQITDGDPITQPEKGYWNVSTTPTSIRIHSDTASAIIATSVINARSRYG